MRAVIRTAVVLLLGAALVVGATQFPGRHIRMAGAGSGITPAAAVTPAARALTRSTVVCPGPESVGVKRIDAASAMSPTTVFGTAPPADVAAAALSKQHAAAASTSVGAVTAGALGGSGPLTSTPLTAPGVSTAATSAPRSIVLSGSGALAPGLAGMQTSLLTTGDLRGLSTLACQQPAAQTWLVGGAGTTGHRGRVILTNPTPNPVTVNLDVYGARGELSSTAARGIVVKAHKRSVVLLDAIAHGEAAPVVHVMASGGVISAVLSDTWLDHTTPAGSDDAAGTMPGRHLLVPGVLGGNVTLRVAATDTAATVHLRVLGAGGPSETSVPNGQVEVAAHTVKDVALTALPAGYDALELTSTAPVVAGVQLTSGAGTPGAKRDLAWTTAQPTLQALSGVPLGPLAAPWAHALTMSAATADATVDLVYVGADGSEATQPAAVPGGTTLTVTVPLTMPVAAGTPASTVAPVAVWIQPRSGAVSAALATTYADVSGGLISIAPLGDAPLDYTPVTVRPLGG